MIALCNALVPVAPMAARVFLVSSTSRMTIMRVRMTLSESVIEKYERLDQLMVGDHAWRMYAIPIAI